MRYSDTVWRGMVGESAPQDDENEDGQKVVRANARLLAEESGA